MLVSGTALTGPELLRSYRIAHARVSAIEPFEASLRENTPLTSINDPSALVEYLSQLNLKGDMVMDELKRVSGDKDSFKTRLEAAEQVAKNAQAEAAELKKERDELLTRVRPASKEGGKSDGDDFFSYESEVPRLQHEIQQKNTRIEELEATNESVNAELETVRTSHGEALEEIKTLKEGQPSKDVKDNSDLKQRFEVLESQSRNIEKSVASVTPVDDSKDLAARVQELCEVLQSAQKARDTAVRHLSELKDAVASTEYSRPSTDLGDSAVQSMQDHVRAMHKERTEAKRARTIADESRNEIQKRLDEATQKLKSVETTATTQNGAGDLEKRVNDLSRELDAAYQTLADTGLFGSAGAQENPAEPLETAAPAEAQPSTNGASGKKKGKNKKKKGGAAAPKSPIVDEANAASKDTVAPAPTAPSGDKEVSVTDAQRTAIKAKLAQVASTSSGNASELQAMIEERERTIAALQSEISEKQSKIDSLTLRLKGEDSLREEVESLRDSLTLIGDDHVVVKDKCKALEAERDELKRAADVGAEKVDTAAVDALKAEKQALEKTISDRAEEIAALKATISDDKGKTTGQHAEMTKQLDDLKAEATTLERDLSAARELAQSRFKDMTALRDHLNKLQPELNSLKKANEELKAGEQKLQQLERSSEALKSEVDSLKSKTADKDAEIKRVSERLRTETGKASSLQEKLDKSQRAQNTAESQHKEASEARTRLTSELSTARDEVKSLRGRLERLEQRAATQSTETQSVKDELELKSAQQASAQSLMDSMQDQTRELATQMKELRERCENLEEERADAHRLLSERSREGETMRRLLSDVESRAEARINEMKDRLNLAVEERDRAEDDATSAARRKGKLIDELRAQLAESEKTAADSTLR